MSQDDFVHLHLHTQYSLLDGANKLPNVLEQAHKLGQKAIAMTDHGNLHGAIEFYLAAKEIGIKPIIGCELYVTPASRHERKMRQQGGGGTHHLTVLASDLTGYRNLCKLSSFAYKEGFYFKPRVDHELLEQFNEGLIVLSGCLASELNSYVEKDDLDGARSLVEFYQKNFKDRFYFEIQPHGISEQQKLNRGCIELAKSMGIPLVATTDCHYLNFDDHFAQEVLMCVSTGKQVTDPDRLRHEGVHLHLKTKAEMLQEFGDTSFAEEAVRNSVSIAERCNLDLNFKTYYMPQYRTENDRPAIEVMAEFARNGLEKRLESIQMRQGELAPALVKEYWDRLELEIALIDKMGFAGYLLVVADFIVWAKEHDIPVGPGRGSAAGSLVAYAMRITDVDPIENRLLFERFLNPDRVSMPDIDVDFCIYGREKVIRYVVEKYGKDNVAQIATFGTLKAKAAIKDVGRALGMSYAETDRIAQLVPAPRQGFDYPLEEALKMEPKLQEYADGEGKELITLAMKLEGLTRHTSTHAAGVVIGDRPLTELLPMMVDKDGNDVTQYSMKYVEKCGLVKFDFLGLKTLTVINTAIKIIQQSRGEKINLELLSLNDPKTYQILCSGNTIGVFQLESTGITEMTMRLKPDCFDDLVAILALYRPGPLDAGMVDHYIERKHGRQKVVYLHPLMEASLKDTYGIILYQEQIMQLARELAGYSLGEADLLRRAMGKKNPEEMAKQRQRFESGAVARGIDKRLASEIFDQMETFARYGFNRSHSAAYAMVSFQTAYLKAHYNVEFMAALMSHEMEDSEKTLKNMNECRRQNIAVLPPDVNHSYPNFSVFEGKIRYGLEAVKGIGEKAVLAIVEAREKEGHFKDLEDFATRVDMHSMNRRVFESLIKCGALDCAGISRREMMERLEDVMRFAQSLQREKDTNQVSLFGGATGVPVAPVMPRRLSTLPEWEVNEKLAYERETLGTYLSGHPLELYQNYLRYIGVANTADIKNKPREGNGKQPEVRIGGVVTALKLKNTKKGDRYASFTLEDWQGTIEAIVWPDTYKRIANLLVSDEPMVVTGRPDITDERCTFIVEKMESLERLQAESVTRAYLILSQESHFGEQLKDLPDLFNKHAGTCPVRVKLSVDGREIGLALRDATNNPVCIRPSVELRGEIQRLFGDNILEFV